mgnify:CR=1 FL=1
MLFRSQDVSIRDGGAFHNIGDVLQIGGAGSTENATGIVQEVTNKSAVTATIVKSGSGYTKENTRLIITGGNGQGFDAVIDSWDKESIGGLTINTDIINSVKNVTLNTPTYFVKNGANTSTVNAKLVGTVSVSIASNTVTGSGTKFQTQLKVGDLIRVIGVANTLRVHAINSNTDFVAVFRPLQNISGANVYTGLAAANSGTALFNAFVT